MADVADVADVAEKHYYVEVNQDNFEAVVLKSEKPVLVDFWAEWCGPCRLVAPTVEELAKDYDGQAVVVKVNIDESPELAERFEVTAIPTLMFIKGGEQVDAIIGVEAKDVVESKLVALLP